MVSMATTHTHCGIRGNNTYAHCGIHGDSAYTQWSLWQQHIYTHLDNIRVPVAYQELMEALVPEESAWKERPRWNGGEQRSWPVQLHVQRDTGKWFADQIATKVITTGTSPVSLDETLKENKCTAMYGAQTFARAQLSSLSLAMEEGYPSNQITECGLGERHLLIIKSLHQTTIFGS